MHKCIFVLMLVTICLTQTSYAKYNQKHGSDYECWYETEYEAGGHGKGNWAYYYCGKQNDKCDGKKSKTSDTIFWQYHGDTFTFQGGKNPSEHDLYTYYCCNGTKDEKGRYVRADSWIDSSKTVTETKHVTGGTCQVKIETDVCGDTHKIDCDTPGTCDAGYIMRNKVCAEICPDGSAFESDTSNKCIQCETTNYQGIKTISSNNKLCIKCDKDTEFFDKETKACIKKSALKQTTNSAMKKCWRCPDNDAFAKCVDIIQKSSTGTDERKILTRCKITE